jgi:DNA-binding MurR/RpiR family transcriptional regulator
MVPQFSKGQKLIASYLVTNFERAAYLTASRLGEEAGVSESTVVRFAGELGLSGYPELQRELQESVRKRLTSVQRIEVANERLTNKDVPSAVLSSDMDNIKYTMENLDRRSFDAAVQAILDARMIYVIGMRSAACLAEFMNHYLSLVFDNVRLVHTTSGSEIFEQLRTMNAQDVMIAVSFPRYSSRIVNAVSFANECGAKVVALTDNKLSPIAKDAYAVLEARSDMASFVDSLAAPLSVINALIAAVGMKKREDVSATLGSLEKVWSRYNVYDAQAKSGRMDEE